MILNILKGLPSGYNRDLQLTKEALIKSFEITHLSLSVMNIVMGKLQINEKNLLQGFSKEVFAADEATTLAKEGLPFRQAYKKVMENLDKLRKIDPVKNIREKTCKGAPGNLSLDESREKITTYQNLLVSEKEKFKKVKERLFKIGTDCQ